MEGRNKNIEVSFSDGEIDKLSIYFSDRKLDFYGHELTEIIPSSALAKFISSLKEIELIIQKNYPKTNNQC